MRDDWNAKNLQISVVNELMETFTICDSHDHASTLWRYQLAQLALQDIVTR